MRVVLALALCSLVFDVKGEDADHSFKNSVGMEFTLIRPGDFRMGEPESKAEKFARRSAERKAELKARQSRVRLRAMLQADDPTGSRYDPLAIERGLQRVPQEGHARENELHRVTITTPFYFGVHEVTNAQWLAVMGGPPRSGEDNDPVVGVTWFEAVAFCQSLSALPDERAANRVYRLPSEAEWEYGCRSGTTSRYSFGDREDALGDFSWFAENSGGSVHPVGATRPSAWGLYDMHGNVWEWCSDWYAAHPTTPQIDPLGPAKGVARVVKGGGAVSPADDLRSANREGISPSASNTYLGFRVALTHPER